MRKFIDENIVMDYYIDLLNDDKIEFLIGKNEKKENIIGLINGLKNSKNMNEKLAWAVKLWKTLFEVSMSSIDSDKGGYDKLFAYFDEYVNFEELIFASDSFYRDHTLHSIWVYFLGEYVVKNGEFDQILNTRMIDYKDNVKYFEFLKKLYKDDKYFGQKYITIIETLEKLDNCTDALRCVQSLTHDLGYPIKKIDKINKSIQSILPFYSINKYNKFTFEFDSIQQHFIRNFIEILSYDMSISSAPKADQRAIYKDVYDKMIALTKGIETRTVDEIYSEFTGEEIQDLKKVFNFTLRYIRNPANISLFSTEIEEYHHGMMSAFLLTKNINAFRTIEYGDSNIEYSEDMKKNLISNYLKCLILLSIIVHTCDDYKIQQIDNGAILTFIDELEEFSRISRASQNREYVEEFCSTYVYAEDGWLNIDFEFENNNLENLDPEKSFKSRCKRFLKLFDIDELDEKLKIRVRCIGKIKTNNNIYELKIARKLACIKINDVEKDIPTYLKSNEYHSADEYENLTDYLKIYG